jgi:hypothetical protein
MIKMGSLGKWEMFEKLRKMEKKVSEIAKIKEKLRNGDLKRLEI